jgi:hypothetical protein
MKKRNITGESFRRFVLKADNTQQANGLYVYNPYYERYGYVNDDSLERGKIPYRVKVHYNKNSELGKGILMNINDLIIVDKRDYEKGGKTPNYNYDYEDIGQFAMRSENWRYFTQEDFREMGKEITETAFNGDLDMAYESIVRQRNRFENGGMTKSDYLKNKYRQVEFVDEDTGELVKVEIPISTDNRRSKSYSPSEERRHRKYEKKDLKHWSKLEDIQSDISTLKDKLKEEKNNYEQLFSDMDHEAGQKAEKWTDADANRYGGDMNDSLIKIKAIEELISKKTDNYNNLEEEYLN